MDTQYFPTIDIYDSYHPVQEVLEKTTLFARSHEYECGYWIQAFMWCYHPGTYQRVCHAFGELHNYMELRYLLEHAIYDPEHPLYGLDYETVNEADRIRLDVLRELSRCYAWYPFVKKDRPNLLPIEERKPLNKKEQNFIRWMTAYYSQTGSWQERNAFYRNYLDKLGKLYDKVPPSADEIKEFESNSVRLSKLAKKEWRIEAQMQHADKQRPPITTYITAHAKIKELFDKKFGSEYNCILIDMPLEKGNLPESLQLPHSERIVLLLPHDVRSHLVLYYIVKDFVGRVSILYIHGTNEDVDPLDIKIEDLRISKWDIHDLDTNARDYYSNQLRSMQQIKDRSFILRGYDILPQTNL